MHQHTGSTLNEKLNLLTACAVVSLPEASHLKNAFSFICILSKQTWKISKICALLFQLSSSLILWKIYSSLACFKYSIQSRLHLAVVLTSRGNSHLLEGCQECTFPVLPPESSAQWIWEAKGPSLEGLMILIFLIRPHNCSFWAAPSRGFG